MSHFCGWNLSLVSSAILTTNNNKKKTVSEHSGCPKHWFTFFAHLQVHSLGEAHPNPPPQVTPFKRCGHGYVKRSAVGAAYPLSDQLLLIGRSSADCVSSVRMLLSHPQGVCVTSACGSVSV